MSEPPSDRPARGSGKSLLPFLTILGVVLLPLLFLALGWPWVPRSEPSSALVASEPPPPWATLPTLETRRAAARATTQTAPGPQPSLHPPAAAPPTEQTPGPTQPPPMARPTPSTEAPSQPLGARQPEQGPEASAPQRLVATPAQRDQGASLLTETAETLPSPQPLPSPRDSAVLQPSLPATAVRSLASEEADLARTLPVTAPPDVPASRLVSPMPPYPQEAWVHGTQGDVQLLAWIDEQGEVTAIEVVRGLPHGLTEAAVSAVSRWRFRPALRDGRPTAAEHALSIRFTL